MLSANVNAAARRVVAYEVRNARIESEKRVSSMEFAARDGR